MEKLIGIGVLIVMWLAYQRAQKQMWFAVIVVGVLSLIYGYTDSNAGDWVCVGIPSILMGSIFYFINRGAK